jgi:hypothetical protein
VGYSSSIVSHIAAFDNNDTAGSQRMKPKIRQALAAFERVWTEDVDQAESPGLVAKPESSPYRGREEIHVLTHWKPV